jgi:hypothetical protein
MRSVVVVLPASMWAMMPMLRVRLSGVSLGIDVFAVASGYQLPASSFQKNSFVPAGSWQLAAGSFNYQR